MAATYLCIRCGIRFACYMSIKGHECKPPKVETGLAV